MKRLISKMIIAALLTVFAGSSIFAASAKVTYVKGKVEVSRGDEWVSLKVGDVVNETETISTGFQSEARLNYNGSVMAVPALSRITLETLKSSGTKETVSIKVDTGAVRSKVTHAEGKRIEYTARTPVGVASVRGTDFTIFANGKAKVFSGAIAYYKASDFVMPSISYEDDAEDETGNVEGGSGDAGTAEGSASEPAVVDTPAAPVESAPVVAETPAAVDKGPATATTTAVNIVDNAPKGAMVVGAGQSSTINQKGVASKPVVEAKKRVNKVKSTVSSASSKEAMEASVASSSATPVTTTETAPVVVPTTASVKVQIEISED